jgi:phospholipid/cholesterol/gamma-HCH transport system ATP-binding protein
MNGMCVRDLSIILNQVPVLTRVSFDVAPGEVMILMGQSGAGKSVLLKALLGLLPRSKGDITIGRQSLPIHSEPSMDFYRTLGVVFQSCALFDSLTVGENITFGLRDALDEPQRRAKAAHLLTQVELDPILQDAYPSALSGGMKRRVSIARAVATSPSFLFFDEPTEGLDPILSHHISVLIRKVCRQLKASAIIICHDLHSAITMGDRVALLHQGQLVWSGSASSVAHATHPVMKDFVTLAGWTQTNPTP